MGTQGKTPIQIFRVDSSIEIRMKEDGPSELGAELEATVDDIWEQVQRSRDVPYVNGIVTSVHSVEPGEISAKFIEYKYVIAQANAPDLFSRLQVRTLAISAVLLTADDCLVFGLRSENSRQRAGSWELVGSGAVDKSSLQLDGTFKAGDQAKLELKEEIGVDPDSLTVIRPLCLLYDPVDRVYDLGLVVRSNQPSAEILARFATLRNEEYQEIRIVPVENLFEFLIKNPVIPVSQELLRVLPELPDRPFVSRDLEDMVRTMYEIRIFEKKLLELFSLGKLSGTTHTCIGQEAISVAVAHHCRDGDYVFGSHRAHGHYIAKGGSLFRLFAEIMGKKDGVCGGLGGSQHLCDGRFFTNGIQGGIVSNATGIALGLKLSSDESSISVVFLGDGTLGEGIIYESLNLASLWGLPILFVLEDNCYAQSTPKHANMAGDALARARAFGIECDEMQSNDIGQLLPLCGKAVDYVRSNRRPFFLRMETYRLEAHSKGDDDRSKEEIAIAAKREPFVYFPNYFDESRLTVFREAALVAIEQAAARAMECECRNTEDLLVDSAERVNPTAEPAGEMKRSITYGESLNSALSSILEDHEDVFLMGEDIVDPYGGAFKVTRGLSTKFPERVLSTPISEAAIVGLAVGSALQGWRPIVEIMFGDFLTLAADQIVNHASKYGWMYDQQVQIGLVIRTPMGGRRGYGPTHSQSLEKIFLGVPNLAVISPSMLHDPGELLRRASRELSSPTLFVEYKLLYGRRVPDLSYWKQKRSRRRFETIHLSLNEFKDADVLIVTYGGSVEFVLEAAERLLVEDEIIVDVLVPSLLSPVPLQDIKDALEAHRIVLTVEEGTCRSGWGSEILAAMSEEGCLENRRTARVAAPDCPIPSSKELELEMNYDSASICKKVRSLI